MKNEKEFIPSKKAKDKLSWRVKPPRQDSENSRVKRTSVNRDILGKPGEEHGRRQT